MKIDRTNQQQSFKGIKLYNYGSRAIERKLLTEAAQGIWKGPLKAFERKGLGFDFVREYDHESRPTDLTRVYLTRKPNYHTKGNWNPLQLVRRVKTKEDANKFFAEITAKTIAFMDKHFKYVAAAKRCGIK